MAIRVVRKGNSSKNNDHKLLINRGLANQHPIEAITNLREELNSKYVKPDTGIPVSDLGFQVVVKSDLEKVTNNINEKIVVINGDIIEIDKDIAHIKDIISTKLKDGVSTIDEATINFAYREGFREEFITEQNDKDFYLINKFIADNKHLKVYRDGELLTPNIDYIEIEDNHVQFTYPLEKDVYMTFICENMVKSISPIHEEILSIENQKIFKLKNQYSPNDNSLSIYVKGKRLENKTHYKEKNPNEIELLIDPFPSGTKFIFRQEGMQNAGQVLYHEKDYQQKTWSHVYVVDKEKSTITLDDTYIPGTNMIEVTVNGLLMWSGSNFDYIEINDKTIKFNYSLNVNDKVRVTCTAALYNWTEKFVSVLNQTIFKLKNIYYTGRDDIIVYQNGLQLFANDDYIEISNNAIEFLEPPPFGSKITVRKRR